MDFLGPTLIVFAVLIGVAIAAVSFQPANPLQHWQRLVEQYATEEQPPSVQFRNQVIRFGGRRGTLEPLTAFVRFDATIDDFGLWFVCRGPDDRKLDAAIKVPGTHVRPAKQPSRGYQFELFAEPPVRIAVDADLGEAIAKKSQSGGSAERAVAELSDDEKKPE